MEGQSERKDFMPEKGGDGIFIMYEGYPLVMSFSVLFFLVEDRGCWFSI